MWPLLCGILREPLLMQAMKGHLLATMVINLELYNFCFITYMVMAELMIFLTEAGDIFLSLCDIESGPQAKPDLSKISCTNAFKETWKKNFASLTLDSVIHVIYG